MIMFFFTNMCGVRRNLNVLISYCYYKCCMFVILKRYFDCCDFWTSDSVKLSCTGKSPNKQLFHYIWGAIKPTKLLSKCCALCLVMLYFLCLFLILMHRCHLVFSPVARTSSMLVGKPGQLRFLCTAA